MTFRFPPPRSPASSLSLLIQVATCPEIAYHFDDGTDNTRGLTDGRRGEMPQRLTCIPRLSSVSLHASRFDGFYLFQKLFIINKRGAKCERPIFCWSFSKYIFLFSQQLPIKDCNKQGAGLGRGSLMVACVEIIMNIVFVTDRGVRFD